jgi:pentatricopeptide repeat protein
MKNRFLDGEQAQCPDSIAYSIVLNKFAQESMYDAAEALLFEMIDDYLRGNDSAKPRTRKFIHAKNGKSKCSTHNFCARKL